MNYAIKKAEELFPHAELLIDDAPVSLFLDELRDLLHSSPRLNLDNRISLPPVPPPRSVGTSGI
jgi:hypothetical protein